MRYRACVRVRARNGDGRETMEQPTFTCVRCGIDVYVATREPWETTREGYRRCMLSVPEPTCSTCVIENVSDYAIITGVIQGGKP